MIQLFSSNIIQNNLISLGKLPSIFRTKSTTNEIDNFKPKRNVQDLINDIFKNDKFCTLILSFIPLSSLTNALVNRRFCKLAHNSILQRLSLKESSQLITSGFTKRILFIGENCNMPYVPYRLIRLMATQIPYVFVNSIYTQENLSKLQSETSCNFNLYAFMVIFSGKNKADLFYKLITLSTKANVYIELKNERNKYSFVNCFSGDVIIDLINNIPESNYTAENIKNNINKSIQRPMSRLHNHLISASNNSSNFSLKRMAETAKENFDFNDNTLSNLKTSMTDHIRLIDPDNSYIYYILITLPHVWIPGIYHAFAIEQYFSIRKNVVLYRVYQTWFNNMTLKDYFAKKGYGDFDEGCLTKQEMDRFLIDLTKILKGDSNKILRKRCFGYVNEKSQIQHLMIDETYVRDKYLAGMVIRYIPTSFKPADCFQHFSTASDRYECKQITQRYEVDYNP